MCDEDVEVVEAGVETTGIEATGSETAGCVVAVTVGLFLRDIKNEWRGSQPSKEPIADERERDRFWASWGMPFSYRITAGDAKLVWSLAHILGKKLSHA